MNSKTSMDDILILITFSLSFLLFRFICGLFKIDYI